MTECIEDTIELCRPRAEQGGLDLSFRISPEIPDQLIGDRLRLSQIFINLVTNAIKFTPEGSVRLSAKVDEETPVSLLVNVSVTDTGRGIPREKQQKIFEKFGQSESGDNSELGGVGLGLSIVRQLVEAMDGSINVESEPDQGSTFSVTVPLAKLGDASVQNLSSGDIALQKTGRNIGKNSLDQLNILLAEDNTLNQQYAREILESAGATVLVADNGASAYQILLSQPVDLLLSDIHMPEMRGDQLLTMVRKELLYPLNTIPVVLLTGADESAVSQDPEVTASACTLSLSKPYSPGQLIEVAGHAVKPPKTQDSLQIDELETEDVSAEMLAIFKADVPVYLRELLIALYSQQEKAFIFQAHKMQSAMWVVELMEEYEMLARLETEKLSFKERTEICRTLTERIRVLMSAG